AKYSHQADRPRAAAKLVARAPTRRRAEVRPYQARHLPRSRLPFCLRLYTSVGSGRTGISACAHSATGVTSPSGRRHARRSIDSVPMLAARAVAASMEDPLSALEVGQVDEP